MRYPLLSKQGPEGKLASKGMHRLHRILALCSRRILAFAAPLVSASLRRNGSSLAASRPLQLQLAASSWRKLRPMCTTSEAHFHKIADETLDALYDRLSALEDQLDDVEVTLSQGVLTANLGSKGSWVINKQTPNRQIWWSSPLSGPRRYEYDAGQEQWCHTRDHSDLMKQLQQEIKQATGIDI